MKRHIIFIISIFTVFILSCEKEIEVRTSYPFTVESDFRENIVVNTLSKTSFSLSPERKVSTNIYTMSYRIVSGNGKFFLNEETPILEGDTIELDALDIDVFFKPDEIGEIKVQVFFSDQQGETQTTTVDYISIDNPFTVELNTISTVATVDESKDFTLILTNTGDDQNVTYTASLFLSQGTGTIDLLNEQGEVVERVNQNETFEITPGTYNYSVTLSDDGINILKVNVEDSNGQKNSDTIEFAVNVINYTFTGEPSSNATTIGNDVQINFNLNETDGGNADYEMRYILTNGDADVFSGATQVSAGTNVDVTLGAYTWVFRPTEIGEVEITFVSRNSTGVEKEVIVRIEVKDRGFDYTVTPELQTVSLGSNVNLNYVITEEGGNQTDTYTMIYSSNLNSSLSINGTQYSSGQTIPLPSIEFTAMYEGLEAGDHEISFIITATSNGLSVDKQTSLTVNDRSFDFTATRSLASLPLGETVSINYVISENGGTSADTYTMIYSTSNNGTLSIDGQEYSAGTVIALSSLSFEAVYTGAASGNHEIESVITAGSNGLEVSKTVNIEYLSSEFTFDVTSDTELTVGDTIPLEFTLNETVGQSTFDVSYSVTGTNQEFRNENNIVLSPNTQYDVENNLFNWSLTAIEQGSMTVRYTAINQFGVSEFKEISYTILPIQFDFTVAPSGTNFLTNQIIRFDFNMDAPSVLTYQLSFESNGTATINYNGIDYNEGQKFTVSNIDFFVRYVTQTPGSNVINWTIEASNGVVIAKSSTINVDQQPNITNFIVTTSNNNDLCFIDEVQEVVLPDHEILFEKSPTASINQVTYLYRNNFGSSTFTRTVDLSLPNSTTTTGKYQAPCVQNASIVSITITDSKGFTSETYTP